MVFALVWPLPSGWWGASSGGCLTVTPEFPEANAFMIDETVRRLVELMRPFAQR